MKVSRLIDTISEYVAKIASYMVLGLVLVVCFDVFMRYLFGRPTTWAYDAALHLYAISFLLGGAWVLNMKAHVKVDVLYSRFSVRTQAIINLIFYVFFLFPMCFYFLKEGTEYVYMSWKMGEVSRSSPLHEPIWPMKLFIPISFAMLTLQGLVEFVRDIITVKQRTS